MNNLFFTALCLVLLYYCLVYLPQQKELANRPLPQNQATQTNLAVKNKQVQTEKDEQIESLKEALTTSRQANQKILAEINQDKKVFSQLAKEMQELNEQL